ncbi:MAG: DegT/DnrJ/EryC1/StrS family protein [Rhodospirillaceae bacterium]|nr:MAG: DegT/DnrJ/EryC1/StrS family protein [Rhodospirillaceae bacterium]
MTDPIPFIDLKAQRRRLGARLDEAILRVVDHGAYIMGAEVAALERQLAAFCGARHAIACASGTDALLLVLVARGIRPGDAVFVPDFTFVATAEVVALLGATPVFVDVLEDTFTMDPASLTAAIGWAAGAGLKARMVIPVDLFGQPADYRRIAPIARAHGLFVLADAAQSFGASLDGRSVGTLGEATATSFFPAKPLGCYGDGGAVFTDDDTLAALIKSIRVHGQGSDKYDTVRIGINGRLDTMQAAILIEKLTIFPDEITARQRAAERYDEGLRDVATVPPVMAGATSVWAQYTIKGTNRDRLAAACTAAGVPTAVYYPLPLSRQTGYRHFPTAPGGTPISDHLAQTVLSLPMHPYLDEATQGRIVETVRGTT